MSFDVGIDIKAQADLEATKQADAAIKQLNDTVRSSSPAAAEAAGDLGQLEKAHGSMGVAARPLRAGLSQVVEQLGLTGPAAHVAGEAMLGLSEGFTRMTGAALGAGVGVSALIDSIKFVKESGKQIDESFESKNLTKTNDDIAKLQDNINARGPGIVGMYVQMWKAIGGVLGFADKENILSTWAAQAKLDAMQQGQMRARLDLTQQLTDKIENQAELIGKTMPEAIEIEAAQAKQALAEQNTQWKLTPELLHGLYDEVDKLKKQKLAEDLRKTSVEINNQVSALQFQTAAVGRSGETFLVLNAAQKINAINTSELARAHADLAAKVVSAEKALLAEQIAASRIQTGQQGIDKFQQQYNVQDPMAVKIAGAKAAELFKVGFDELFKQHGTEDQQIKTFIQFIQQQLANGVPDIQELLLSKGVSSPQLESLKSGAKTAGYGDLIKQLEANMQTGQQWGKQSDEEFQQYQANVAEAGKDLQGFQKHYEDLTAVVAKGIAMTVDVTGAISNVDDVMRKINGIPDVIQKTLVLNVQYTNLLPGLEQEIQRGTGLDLGTRVYP